MAKNNFPKKYISQFILIFSLMFVYVSIAQEARVVSLQKIEYQEEMSKAEVHMHLSNNCEFTGSLFKDPLRIVIDLKPVLTRLTQSNLDIKGSYLETIQTFQHQVLPDYIARVVIHLKNLTPSSFNYSIKKEAGAIIVAINVKIDSSMNIAEKSTEQETSKDFDTTPDEETVPDSPIYSDMLPQDTLIQKPLREDESIHADYVIGPEDLLEIKIFELPELSNTVRVLSTGKINFPPLGEIEVSGLSKSEAEEKIRNLLQEGFINDAHVVIFIKEFKSQKVDVIGSVRKPGNYSLLRPKTVLEILSEAGGLNDNSGDMLILFRKNGLHMSKIEINLKNLLEEGKTELNVVVKPGDIINIPEVEKISIYVYGEVGSPGAIEIRNSINATLLKAIIKAGGPTDRANIRKISIKRLNRQGKEEIIKINLKDVIKGKVSDIKLQDGDIVIVPESFF